MGNAAVIVFVVEKITRPPSLPGNTEVLKCLHELHVNENISIVRGTFLLSST